MKIRIKHLTKESGSVLVTTLIITFVLGTTLASFLLLTQHQTLANSRSQSWNHTLAVAEAGAEDALQMINKYADDSTQLLNWSKDIQAGGTRADSWTYLGNDVYLGSRTIGLPVDARYEVRINNARPNAPSILVVGGLLFDYQYEHGAPATATAGATSGRFETTELKRRVLITTRRDGLFTTAMLADVSINLNGNNISTDSFNSADPTASYWAPGASHGIYDPTLTTDRGDVACNSNLENSLNAGNADIMGHISTGPGGEAAIGANGSVGSESWVASGTTGIEPGYSSDDMNVRLEDVELPAGNTWSYLGVNPVVINGVTYQHYIGLSGDYTLSTLQGSLYVASNVTARLHITDDVNLADGGIIQIDENAGGLKLYMEGSRFKVSGAGVVNNTGDAAKFLYFGLPSNVDIQFNGNASFTGAIYANQAQFSMGGGGDDINDFIGAVVARTIMMNGHFNFHYDENLANLGPSRGFVPTTWTEL